MIEMVIGRFLVLRVNVMSLTKSNIKVVTVNISPRKRIARCYRVQDVEDIPGLAQYIAADTLAGMKITSKQLKCIAWVAQGKSSDDVGALLGKSRRTVDGHIRKLCARLGVRTRVQAVLVMCDLGFLTPVKPKIGAKKRVTLRVVI